VAKKAPLRWAIDTCIVIGAMKRGESAEQELLLRAQEEGITIVASTLLIAECVRTGTPQGDATLDRFLQSSTIHWVECTRRIAVDAREVARRYPKLKGADAVHFASAVAGRATVLFTRDKRGFPIGHVVDGVQLCGPAEIPGQLAWAIKGKHETD
jgi:predicted nucleic acid-binding protein